MLTAAEEMERQSSYRESESEGSWSLDIKCHSHEDRDLIPCVSVFTEKVSEGPLSFFSPLSEDFNIYS